MKIVVTIKQAPARDSFLRIDSKGTWIQEDDLGFEINEPDAYALEAGLKFKEKNGGEVIALCAGPARAGQTIREALKPASMARIGAATMRHEMGTQHPSICDVQKVKSRSSRRQREIRNRNDIPTGNCTGMRVQRIHCAPYQRRGYKIRVCNRRKRLQQRRCSKTSRGGEQRAS